MRKRDEKEVTQETIEEEENRYYAPLDNESNNIFIFYFKFIFFFLLLEILKQIFCIRYFVLPCSAYVAGILKFTKKEKHYPLTHDYVNSSR